jgi:hypothetical protein
MYHPSIIQRRLTAAFDALNRNRAKSERVEPQYHSPAECQAARKHLEKSRDPESGNLIRKLDVDELSWIRNERILCQCDYGYYKTHYVHIRDWTDRVSLIGPNYAQGIVNSIWGEMELQQFAILMLQLKARRLGVSTETEIAVAHRVQFYSNVNAVVASSDPDKSKEMSGIMELAWDNMPWWLMPSVTAQRAGELIEFGNQNSAVSIQHGTQFSGIARGSTPSIFHLCLCPNTLVITQDGMARPIREILSGDTVITSKGSLAKVKHVVPSGRRNELTSEIWLHGNFAPLSCTRDHKILTPEGMKESRLIEKDDWVRMPVRPITKQIKDFTLTVLPHGKTHKHAASRTLPLDREWGWFFGLYLAEGSVLTTERNGKRWSTGVLFSVDVDEVPPFMDRLKSLMGEKHIGVGRQNSRTRVLRIDDSMLGRFVLTNFGRVDSKRIPDWAWNAGSDFCKGLIEGYLEGDGHQKPSSNEIFATSIRLQLPVQLRSLCASMGYGWSAFYYRPAGLHYGRNCKDSWTFHICGYAGKRLRESMGWTSTVSDAPEHWRYSERGDFIDIRVERREDGWSDEFWDLEVDAPEHDFCTLQCCVANSELPDFTDPEGLIDASLLRAIIDSPSTFGVLESTAAGRGNWLHKKWKYCVQNWPSTSRLRPVFLPWYVGKDIYPTETWLRQHPIPPKHQFESITIRHAERAAAYVESNELLRHYLGEDWRMPARQKWFWEATRREYEAQGALGKFLAELCSDDVEAFQHDKHNPFGVELISQYHNATSQLKPDVYGFQAREDIIPARMQPDPRDIDTDYEPIYFKPLPNAPSLAPRNVKLVRLKWHGMNAFDPLGKLLIWKDWEPGFTYGNGIDTGYGIGRDRSVIETLRKGTLENNEEQCAEFCSPYVNANDLAPIAYIIGTLYSSVETGFDGEGHPQQTVKQCHQAIEVQANGEITQLELRKMGWTEFHHWVCNDRRKINPAKADRIGWATVPWSRALLMSESIKYLRDGWVDINSPWLVEEMQALVQDDYAQSMKAAYGEFDDRYMAFAIILAHFHMLEMGRFGPTIAEQRVARRAMDDPNSEPEAYSFGAQSQPVYGGGVDRMVAEAEETW